MLKELEDIEQFAGEPRRRWFADEYVDLKIAKFVYEKILQYPIY